MPLPSKDILLTLLFPNLDDLTVLRLSRTSRANLNVFEKKRRDIVDARCRKSVKSGFLSLKRGGLKDPTGHMDRLFPNPYGADARYYRYIWNARHIDSTFDELVREGVLVYGDAYLKTGLRSWDEINSKIADARPIHSLLWSHEWCFKRDCSRAAPMLRKRSVKLSKHVGQWFSHFLKDAEASAGDSEPRERQLDASEPDSTAMPNLFGD